MDRQTNEHWDYESRADGFVTEVCATFAAGANVAKHCGGTVVFNFFPYKSALFVLIIFAVLKFTKQEFK